MTIRDLTKIVRHWQEGATSDLRSAHLLLAGRQFLQALFFCHLAIEKTLKARVVQDTSEHAPYVHNLIYLAGKTGLVLSKDQMVFLETMNRFNIEGRYPAYQAKLRKEIRRETAAAFLRSTEAFIRWCQKKS